MSCTIQDNKIYLTCECNNGLICIEHIEWPLKGGDIVIEFEIELIAPCGIHFWHRLKMAWQIFWRGQTHYLVLDGKDAEKLSHFLNEKFKNAS